MNRYKVIGIIASMFFAMTVYGQVPFAPVGSEWYFHLGNCACPLPDIYPRVFVDRDTIIDGRYCTIMEQGDGITRYPLSEIILHDDNGKVYFYEEDEFYLMYDFSPNLTVGDIIEYHIPKNGWTYDFDDPYPVEISNPYFIEVIDIDYIEVSNGNLLRKFLYDPTYTYVGEQKEVEYCPNLFIVAIEGIGGSGSSLIKNDCFIQTGGYISSFACYQNNEFAYSEFSDKCITPVININQNLIKIFPNPIHRELQIYNQTSYHIKTVKLFNIDGQCIGNYDIKDIDITYLNAGIYFVEIQFGNFSIRKKIVKL